MSSAPRTVLSSGLVPVAVSNLTPIVGVVALGWSAPAVLLVYLAELAGVCVWTVVKIPFAHRRPNNDVADQQLLGPLQAKRGGTVLPGPLPPVYVRNVPLLVVAVVLTPVVVALAFVPFAMTRPEITESVAAAALLGGTVVVLARGVETCHEYFRRGGYREHSPRSLLLAPFKSLLVVGAVYVLFVGFESVAASSAVLNPTRSVLVLAVGKFAHDIRAHRIEQDDSRRSLFQRLYGSRRTEIEPEPVRTPSGQPDHRLSMGRKAALVDALAWGVRYGFGKFGFVSVSFTILGLVSSAGVVLAFGLGFGLLLGAIRAGTRYLRYGTLEYRCYSKTLVAHDRLLDEPQARLDVDTVTDARVSTGLVDRLLGTETLAVEVTTEDEDETQWLVPDPEEVGTDDDANESTAMTLVHVRKPERVTETLGIGWCLDEATD